MQLGRGERAALDQVLACPSSLLGRCGRGQSVCTPLQSPLGHAFVSWHSILLPWQPRALLNATEAKCIMPSLSHPARRESERGRLIPSSTQNVSIMAQGKLTECNRSLVSLPGSPIMLVRTADFSCNISCRRFREPNSQKGCRICLPTP